MSQTPANDGSMLGRPVTISSQDGGDVDDDPEEVDISEMSSQQTKSQPSQAANDFETQRRMMQQMMGHRPPQSGDNGPAGSSGTLPNDTQDPFGILRQMQAMQGSAGAPESMMNPFAMLQQMQASADSGGSGFPNFEDGSTATGAADPFAMMNQMMSNLGGGMPGMPAGMPGMPGMPPGMQQQRQKAPRSDPTTRLWRLIHAASIILLLLFLDRASLPTLGSPYSAGLHHRSSSSGNQSPPPPPPTTFWAFVTLELVLQSTRLFLYGPVLQDSMLTQIGGILPPPYNGYANLLARYSLIFTTLRDDFFLLLVGLGISAWWRTA